MPSRTEPGAPHLTHIAEVCRVPIYDLTYCQDLIEVPIELTRETQAKLQAKLDERIYAQVIKHYVIVPPGEVKRLKPHILRKYA
jgi:hypothetical protein